MGRSPQPAGSDVVPGESCQNLVQLWGTQIVPGTLLHGVGVGVGKRTLKLESESQWSSQNNLQFKIVLCSILNCIQLHRDTKVFQMQICA